MRHPRQPAPRPNAVGVASRLSQRGRNFWNFFDAGDVLRRRAMATSIIAMFKPPNRPKADAIISAVKANPALAKEVDAASGNTPLHFACCNCAPDEVVHALLAAYPKAAKAADGAGNLPIVGAVASGCGIAAVQALLKAHPEGIRARQGPHTLLHTAACNGQTVDVIDLLIATWPEAAAEQDPDGNSPLHFAAACQQTPDVVKSLIAACPDAAKWRGQLKRYPLSLCLLTEAPPESVELIRDAYPDAVRAHEIVADYQNHGEGASALWSATAQCKDQD